MTENSGKPPGASAAKIVRRTLADGGLRLLVQRGRQEWPPLAQAPGVRVDHLSLEDLFLEVAE